ncbi:NirD/YgiW/YdeI family stress tolerance protein [Moraxella canis]|uniref:NirD/YgiW/YdeI family stress tolerance protein n=1 Tax=Moraxella canis TaxID=90239 RepID=A0ABZ0WV80_9GAMM|nr:NirD/YgiW/YdeI family stress tolerance protein [Moraxella canis]WQE03133.1 NirD/YgiW/YdeI family stress tolerance protein [Moraxella canis]
MKIQHIAVAAVAAITLSACTAHANNQTQATKAPAVMPTAQNSTIAQAKTFRDDTKVAVQGKLTRYVGDEKFELQDGTGSIIVEIDDDYYQNNPQSLVGKTVIIHGEIDRDDRRIEIDAKRLQVR